jgi:hypothetical protein
VQGLPIYGNSPLVELQILYNPHQNPNYQPGMVAYTCNPNTREAEDWDPEFELHNKFGARLEYIVRPCLKK